MSFEQYFSQLVEALQIENEAVIKDSLTNFHDSDLPKIVQSLPPKYRFKFWQYFNQKQSAWTLKELSNEVQTELISQMSSEQLIAASSKLDLDDLADIIPNLPKSALHNLLLTMDIHRRDHLAQVLSYPKNSAGGLMNTDIITVRSDISVDVVLRYLRLLKKMPTDTDQIFVVDKDYQLLGSLFLSTLITQDPKQDIAFLISQRENVINADMSDDKVADLFADRNLISAPVVSAKGQLIGRITIDDVVDVIKTKAEHSVLSMAGLDEEDDLFSPVLQSANRRILWLFLNLITAFIAVFVIGLFEATLMEKIALAVLMPVVASMGGIAGTQTLILFTRGIATNKISRANVSWLFNKELGIGFLNGLLWSFFIAIAVYFWFTDLLLSTIIAVAIMINLLFAAIFGSFLPLMLTKLRIDPALAGGVILTTITDVVGFATFLGLASLVIS